MEFNIAFKDVLASQPNFASLNRIEHNVFDVDQLNLHFGRKLLQK